MSAEKKKIIKFLYDYGEKCGFECGTLAPTLARELEIEFEELKEELRELIRAKKVIWRDGAQGVLFFLNYDNLKPEDYEVPPVQE